MDEVKKILIDRAKAKHGSISPAGSCKTLEDSFSIVNDKLIFWFNAPSNSTHTEIAVIGGHNGE